MSQSFLKKAVSALSDATRSKHYLANPEYYRKTRRDVFMSGVSVFAGFFSVALLSIVTDAVLEKAGVMASAATTDAMLALALAYRSVYTVVGGWITAKLAPQNTMKHVVALMILGGLGGVGGMIGGWSLGHHWYTVSIAVTGPLLVWIGGKIALRK